jgi:hypothetical protein
MEMAAVQIILLIAVIVLNVVVLVKVNKLFQELRTPIVKRLTPELIKGRKINVQEPRNSNNRESRTQQLGNNSQRQNTGSVKQAATNVGQSEQRSEQRPDRNNRNDRHDRNDRNDRHDRNGRNNRNGRRDRGERRPLELQGNEAAEPAQTDAVQSTPANVSSFSTPVENIQTASAGGRRPLEPRTSEPVVSANVTTEVSAPETADRAEGMDFDPTRMRHGRRTVVKKPPSFEEGV